MGEGKAVAPQRAQAEIGIGSAGATVSGSERLNVDLEAVERWWRYNRVLGYALMAGELMSGSAQLVSGSESIGL
jgi:hypothetical protein